MGTITSETSYENARAVIDTETDVEALRSYTVVILDTLKHRNGALKAICTTNDSGPWIDVYRDAGGGYEGLQAIAVAALGTDA